MAGVVEESVKAAGGVIDALRGTFIGVCCSPALLELPRRCW
jgi:hypothetical protein